MARSLALLMLVACTDVPRNNPLDPAAPETVRSSARLTGQITFEAGTTAEAEVLALEALQSGDTPRSFTATPDESGGFALDVPSGIYNVFVKAARFTPAAFYGISVQPGQTYGLGGLTLLLARGSISGQVLVSDGISRAGSPAVSIPVSFVRVDDASGLVFSAITGADGRFRSDGVPEGRYIVRASKDGYAPGYLSQPLDVSNTAAATAAPITLYPASAIVRPVGGKFTAARAITVDLLAFVDGLRDMRVSEDATFAGVDYASFSASITFELADTEGTHKIYAQFRDAAGLESPVFSASVVLDRTAPTVSQLEIAGGKLAITDDDASIALGGYDLLSGVRGYRLSTDGTLDSEPELAAESVGSAISLVVQQPFVGADGDRTVKLVWIDRAGNVSPEAQAVVTKDTTAPQLAGFSIVGAPYVQSAVVTLNVLATGATQMLISNRSDFADASWEPYLSARTWVLPPGDGLKLVYLRVRDTAGNTLDAVSAQATLDATPPTSVVGINSFYNGQGVTTSATVTLNLDATDATSGLTKVQISNSQDFSGAPLEDWQATRSAWPLTAGDGLKFVYVRFLDAAGNASVASNFITKDTTGPAGNVSIREAPRTNQSTVEVLVNAVDADTMQISGDVDLTPTFQPYAASVQVPLAVSGCVDAGECPRTVNVILRDVNLNAASAAQASVVYDIVDPFLQSGGPSGGTINATQPIALVFSEPLRRSSVVAIGGIASNSQPAIFATTTSNDDTLRFRPFVAWPQGTQTLTVSYADRAGNSGTSIAYTFTVDGVAPTGSLSPVSGTPIKRDRAIVIDFNEEVNTGATSVTGSLTASGVTAAWSNGNTRLTLSAQSQWPVGADLTLQINVEDLVGNQRTLSATYTVDTTRPNVSSFAPSGGVIGPTRPIVVTFDEAIEQNTLSLSGSLTTGVNITRLWLSPQSVRLTPDAWPTGSRTLSIDGSDIAGNSVNGNPSATYTVDARPPVGSLTAPATGTVDASTSVQIHFDEQMNTASQVVVQGPAALGAASTSWSGGDTLTLTGPWQLGKDRSFTVTAQDIAGNTSVAVVVTLSIVDGAIYVSAASGSPSNPGTFDAPLLTIPAAISVADALYSSAEVRVAGGAYPVSSDNGSHVILAPGINLYGGFSPDFTARDPLLYASVVSNTGNGPGTALTPSRAVSCSTSGAVVDGFTLLAAPTGDYTTAVACLSTGAPTLVNNVVQRGAFANVSADSVLLRSPATVLRNAIVGPVRVETADAQIISNTIAGGVLLTGNNALVANNTITGASIGISIEAMGPATIVNNIIVCSAGSGAIGVLETLDTTPAMVANNDISCGTALYADFVSSGANCPAPYNTSHACFPDAASLNGSAVANAVEGNIDVAPVFADAALHLSASTALDVLYGGRVVAASGATRDLDGLLRTLGNVGPSGAQNIGAAGWSMGAFEAP